MVTQDERRALVFLAVVASVGAALRVARPAREAEPVAAAVAPELPAGNLVRQAAASQRAESLARPLGATERVDLNRAPADELDRLPRVGPALARRIVEDRAAHGPYRSLQELRRVPGIGPRLLAELERHVSFDGVPTLVARPLPRPADVAGPSPSPAPAGRRAGPEAECPARVAVNAATADALTCLPGVGPVLAERIVSERTARGPFRDIGDLARVPGLGPKRRARLADRVTIP